MPSLTCQNCGQPIRRGRYCGQRDCTLARKRADNLTRYWSDPAAARNRVATARQLSAQPCIDCGQPVPAEAVSGRCLPCTRTVARALAVTPEALASRILTQRAKTRQLAPYDRRLAAVARANSRGTRVWTAGTCAECGSPYVSGQPGSRYCSAQCVNRVSWRRKQARRGDFAISRQDRLAIYDRDQWTCQLCQLPVDPELDHTHPMGATLDHIICISWTTNPDHSPSNLRLAHRWCNSMRGNRIEGVPGEPPAGGDPPDQDVQALRVCELARKVG